MIHEEKHLTFTLTSEDKVSVKELAKTLCTCHHKCHDTKDCVVEDEALLLINENKSNNFDVKSNKVVKSTDWLTKGYSEEKLARMKAEAIEEAEEEIHNKELFKQALVEGVNRHIDKAIAEIKVVTYEQERLNHFIDRMEKAQKKYDRLYKKYKDSPHLSEGTTLLSDAGRKLNFYKDVIAMLEQDNRKQSEGEWISSAQTDEYICSLCDGIAPVDCEREDFYKSNFCPNCGARMRGEKSE